MSVPATSDSPPPGTVAVPPVAFQVEQRGIDTVPLTERWATPRDVFALVFGGANSISTALLGAIPVLLGLGFTDSLIAVVIGVVIGALILAPMVLFGRQNGTNNAVSSSAHFGVHGRLLGSLLSLLTAFTFLALAVWTAGDAVIGVFATSGGTEVSDVVRGGVYLVLLAVILAICIFGYRLLVLLNRFVPPVVAVLFVVGVIAFLPRLDGTSTPGFGADRFGDSIFLTAFFGAILVAMSCPISYGAFLGDYSRYVAPGTSGVRLMGSVVLAQVASLIPFTFGLTTATVAAQQAPEFIANGDYIGGLFAVIPFWLTIPMAIIALAGGLSVGTSLLYGTGLDFSSIIPRLSRVASTIVIAVLTVALVLVGKFVFDMVGTVSTLSTLVVICTTPWIIIMIIGYVSRSGWYSIDDLHVFNRRQTGGRYWYWHGWNVATVAAYLISAGAALMFVNLPGQFVGPLSAWAGGLDLSLIVAIVLAVILGIGALFVSPEPRYVFGPTEPRVPTRDGEPAPIVTHDSTP